MMIVGRSKKYRFVMQRAVRCEMRRVNIIKMKGYIARNSEGLIIWTCLIARQVSLYYDEDKIKV